VTHIIEAAAALFLFDVFSNECRVIVSLLGESVLQSGFVITHQSFHQCSSVIAPVLQTLVGTECGF
jgi:hypothetical protein